MSVIALTPLFSIPEGCCTGRAQNEHRKTQPVTIHSGELTGTKQQHAAPLQVPYAESGGLDHSGGPP